MLSKRVRVKRVLTPIRYLFDPQLSRRMIFGHVIPTSREKKLPKLKILPIPKKLTYYREDEYVKKHSLVKFPKGGK